MSEGPALRSGHEVTVVPPHGNALHLVVYDRLSIGRATDGLLVADDRVSRRHCELAVRGTRLVVRDLGSSNGTLVNGVAITGEQELGGSDVVTIGDTRIHLGHDLAGGAANRDDDVARTAVGALGSPARAATGSQPRATAPTTATAADVEGDGQRDDLLRASMVGTTITLVFSDIIDSTALVHRLGDQRWLEVLQRHDQLTRAVLDRCRGTEVKGQGDGFLLTFPSARHALSFALGLQSLLGDERARDAEFPVHVRIGVHTGEVLHDGGDVFGRHVHRAARISALAGTDEVVASSLVRELAESMGDITFGPAEQVQLKGFDGLQVVHRVRRAPGPGVATPPP